MTKPPEVPNETCLPASPLVQFMQFGIQLHPGDHSDPPSPANLIAMQGVRGVMFFDVGFPEPQEPAFASCCST